MKNLISILFLILFVLSCTPQFQVIRATDKFYPGKLTTYTTIINIKASNPFDLASLDLQFGHTSEDENQFYFFAFTYMGDNWVFMESLRILADGEAFSVRPTLAPTRKVISGNLVTEYMGVRFTEDEFLKIKQARRLEVRVIGSNRRFDFAFDADLKEKLSQFLKEVNAQQA